MTEAYTEVMALNQAKKGLRKQIKQVLSTTSQESINRQSTVTQSRSHLNTCSDHGIIAISTLNTLFRLPEFQNARAISVYLSMPTGEISTQGIVHSAFHQGKKVFVPYTYKMKKSLDNWPTSIMDMVQLESLADYQSLQPDNWGIPTPSAESIEGRPNAFGGKGKSEGDQEFPHSEEGLDIVVMPGMAFDRRLERLGHGKGYYDFFLQRYLHHAQKIKSKMPFLGKHDVFFGMFV
jgi:5-formyltetrahydrofolate cyclo-ligase